MQHADGKCMLLHEYAGILQENGAIAGKNVINSCI
jgi:hypothetical protein